MLLKVVATTVLIDVSFNQVHTKYGTCYLNKAKLKVPQWMLSQSSREMLRQHLQGQFEIKSDSYQSVAFSQSEDKFVVQFCRLI